MKKINKHTQKMVILASIGDKRDSYAETIGARVLILRACSTE